MKLFDKIHEMIDEEDTFMCVLIDEIESLAASRASMSGNEPSDAIRVVNAVLTQIDRLRHRRNVIILATTNITKAVDVAFVDRADIAMYIGPPSIAARYLILRSCAEELMKKGLILPRKTVMEYRSVMLLDTFDADSTTLVTIAEKAEGLSGRALRKLPFLAHAFYLQGRPVFSLEEFVAALGLAIEKEYKGRAELHQLCK